MANEGFEQRLQQLEEENKKLRFELERTQAVNEIRNIVGTLQAYHTACQDNKIQTLFSNRKDNRVYFGSIGYWESTDASDRAGALLTAMPKVGNMPLHLMCNPIIVISDDGQTAQAYFIAAGIVAMKDNKTGKPTCSWEWNRYGMDFIKEDGQWKIWHHHVFDLFHAGWNEKWEAQFSPKEQMSAMEPPFKPDGPPTPLDKGYNPNEELPFIPIPQPYKTWDPKQMY